MKTILFFMAACVLVVVAGCGDTYVTNNSNGTSGAGGSATASSTSTGSDQCGAGKKRCGAECANIDEPATGCGGPTCDPCPTPHAVAVCANQACAVSTCVGTWHDCDGKQDNGCESDPATDPFNCGGCGKSCAAAGSLMGTCSAGKCTIGQCVFGRGDCDGLQFNGCETDTTGDVNNCNGCMMECPSGIGCFASVCAACGHTFNYPSNSTAQLGSGSAYAFKYVPKHAESVSNICIRAMNDFKGHTVRIMSDNSGPATPIDIAGAVALASDPTHVICAKFTKAHLLSGGTYWIESDIYYPYQAPGGESVDMAVTQDVPVVPSSSWAILPDPVLAIFSVESACE